MADEIKVRLRKGVIYHGLLWPMDAVMMMDKTKAEYLIGTNHCFRAADGDVLTPVPVPTRVKQREGAVNVAQALAEALKSAMGNTPTPVNIHKDVIEPPVRSPDRGFAKLHADEVKVSARP